MRSKEALERIKNTLNVGLKDEVYIDDIPLKINRELLGKDLDILYKLVERAQEQEMLLELYKGYYKINESKSMVEFLKRTDEFELIKAKIKELENGNYITL